MTCCPWIGCASTRFLATIANKFSTAGKVLHMAKDYFSTQSAIYNTYRPRYPDQLFRYLCEDFGENLVVWDCATGNGQAALALKPHAASVIATDQSAKQLRNAATLNGVHYVQAMAEDMPVAANSIDLITVAQALHWFDFDRFYAEARRVLKPGGRIAAWTYSFLSVSPQLGGTVDDVVKWFYHDVIGPYWPPERRWVDEHYQSIPFPFHPRNTPKFSIAVDWDLASVVGYMGTWSAVQQYFVANGRDPMPLLYDRIHAAWGDPNTLRHLDWPLGIRVGEVE